MAGGEGGELLRLFCLKRQLECERERERVEFEFLSVASRPFSHEKKGKKTKGQRAERAGALRQWGWK